MSLFAGMEHRRRRRESLIAASKPHRPRYTEIIERREPAWVKVVCARGHWYYSGTQGSEYRGRCYVCKGEVKKVEEARM